MNWFLFAMGSQRPASRCWALGLAFVYENRTLECSRWKWAMPAPEVVNVRFESPPPEATCAPCFS
jgi:hypothetical protein